MILIVTFPRNEHVLRVLQHLKRPVRQIDTADFPMSLGLFAHLCSGSNCESVRFQTMAGEEIRQEQVGAIWYRRLRTYELAPDLRDEAAHAFAWSETHEALQGAWLGFECFWMNHPVADEASQRKLRQLQLARRVGLTIPDTLITNQPAEALNFIEHHGLGRVIRKAFRILPQAPSLTTIIQQEHLAQIESVRLAPVIFQKFIPCQLDLRITAVDGELFAAAIKTPAEFEADYRVGLGQATFSKYDLPDKVAEQLLALMDQLTISYGAIDMRVTPEGEHVFFEVNPAGEYLFVADRTDLPIAQAIAACLDRHDEEHGG